MFASGGGPDAPHRPVLLAASLRYLAPERGGLFLDATLGLGGHSEALLEASPAVRVLGIDRDTEALRFARERLARFDERFRAVHANFKEIAGVIEETGEDELSKLADEALLPDEALIQLEEQHGVRLAVSQLDERCGKLLTLLFYEDEPLPYTEIAARIGVPEGSIGPTRARCLQKLLKILEKQG